MKVTVYTKPECVQCEYTKRQLDKDGVPYLLVDIVESPMAADLLRDAGYRSMPVVMVSTDNGTRSDVWQGFKPDRLKGLKDTGGY